MNKTSSPFYCACLICPLSFLLQLIFTDTPPSPTRLSPSTSLLTATYITLTNHRLRGFFSSLAFTPDMYFFRSAFPSSRVVCKGDKNDSSQRRHASIPRVTCCSSKSSSVSVECPRRVVCFYFSLYFSHTLPPLTAFFPSHLPPSFLSQCLGAEHIGMLQSSGSVCVPVMYVAACTNASCRRVCLDCVRRAPLFLTNGRTPPVRFCVYEAIPEKDLILRRFLVALWIEGRWLRK